MHALLFVYGTLRQADPGKKAALLGEVRYLGKGTVRGILFTLGEYPGASPAEEGLVEGEVVELADFSEQIAVLDRYELCDPDSPEPHEYRRELTEVKLEDGTTVEAWIYWYNWPLEGLARIESADWLK